MNSWKNAWKQTNKNRPSPGGFSETSINLVTFVYGVTEGEHLFHQSLRVFLLITSISN